TMLSLRAAMVESVGVMGVGEGMVGGRANLRTSALCAAACSSRVRCSARREASVSVSGRPATPTRGGVAVVVGVGEVGVSRGGAGGRGAELGRLGFVRGGVQLGGWGQPQGGGVGGRQRAAGDAGEGGGRRRGGGGRGGGVAVRGGGDGEFRAQRLERPHGVDA